MKNLLDAPPAVRSAAGIRHHIRDISGTSARLLIYLGSRWNIDTGQLNPSTHTIAEDFGVAERTVQKWFAKLNDEVPGMAIRVPKFNEHNGQLCNQIELARIAVNGELANAHLHEAQGDQHSHPPMPPGDGERATQNANEGAAAGGTQRCNTLRHTTGNGVKAEKRETGGQGAPPLSLAFDTDRSTSTPRATPELLQKPEVSDEVDTLCEEYLSTMLENHSTCREMKGDRLKRFRSRFRRLCDDHGFETIEPLCKSISDDWPSVYRNLNWMENPPEADPNVIFNEGVRKAAESLGIDWEQRNARMYG